MTVWVERAFALYAWTGSRMFNRATRLLANEHGLSLSAHCLLTVPNHAAGGHGASCQLVPYETHPAAGPVNTEEDVLRLLGIPWLPPGLRNA